MKSFVPLPAIRQLPRSLACTGHHTLVQQAVAGIQTEHQSTGGQLGKPASARRRVYERLKDYACPGEGYALRYQAAPPGD